VSGIELSAQADTFISLYAPTTNYGDASNIRVRSPGVMHALLRFDLSDIPPNAIVQKATLLLYQTARTNSNPLQLEVYALHREWHEREANWHQAGAGQPWMQPGANGLGTDRDRLPVAIVNLDQDQGPVNIDLSTLVQMWVQDPASNYGILLRGTSIGQVQARNPFGDQRILPQGTSAGKVAYFFASRENSVPENQPRLQIQYVTMAMVTPTPTGTVTATASPTPTPTPTPSPQPTVISGPPTPPPPTPGPPAHNHNAPYSTTTDACAGCHRVHMANGGELRRTWPEEALCMSCHDGTGASTDIRSQFQLASRHPIDSSAGLHQANERTPDRFTGAHRHVECEDCHNPHDLAAGTHAKGSHFASGVLQDTWGIAVSNGAGGTTPSYSVVQPITYEYELCFKCHSSWSSTGSGTDVSVEFNPNNYAHHAVEAPGNNQPGSANPYFALTFVSPWGPQSTVQCGDCHGGPGPQGPHGSSREHILRYNETGQGTTAVFCYNCHSRDVYGDVDLTNPPNQSYSRFPHPYKKAHTKTSTKKWTTPLDIWCLNCHGGKDTGGIHGTNRGPGQYGTTPLGKRFMNGAFINGWTATSTGGTCWPTCHSKKSYKANYDYPP